MRSINDIHYTTLITGDSRIEFTPQEPGEFGFSCGVGMLHGKLIVR